jgi:DNA-binding MarR family transcriptional regulator
MPCEVAGDVRLRCYDVRVTSRPARASTSSRAKPTRRSVSRVEQHSAGRSAGFLLWHASLRWQRRITEVLSPMGITHVQFALVSTVWWLGKDGYPPRQREVAEHAGIDPAMTSQVMAVLIERGWVVRGIDPVDARASRLYVTDSGREVAERAVVALDKAEAEFFGPAGDRELTLEMLRTLAGRDEFGRNRDA